MTVNLQRHVYAHGLLLELYLHEGPLWRVDGAMVALLTYIAHYYAGGTDLAMTGAWS